MMDAYAQEAAQVAQVAVDSMSVGDATGPIGLLVAALVALDRLGLLRRNGDASTETAILTERLAALRSAYDAHVTASAAALDAHRRDIRERLDRLDADVRQAIRDAQK